MSHQIIAREIAAGFTCLVGPPGSGVTAVSTELGGRHPPIATSDCRHARSTSAAAPNARTACSHNRIGIGAPILRMALIQVQFGAGSVAVLPRSPATVAQLRLLRVATRTVGIPLSVIELDAPDLVLAGRIYARHTRDGEAGGEPEPGELVPRHGDHRGQEWRSDEIHAFLDTLHGYRLRQRGLRLAAAEFGVPWVRLVSGVDRRTRASAVRDVLTALITGSPTPRPKARQTACIAGATNSGNKSPTPTRPLPRAGPLGAR